MRQLPSNTLNSVETVIWVSGYAVQASPQETPIDHQEIPVHKWKSTYVISRKFSLNSQALVNLWMRSSSTLSEMVFPSARGLSSPSFKQTCCESLNLHSPSWWNIPKMRSSGKFLRRMRLRKKQWWRPASVRTPLAVSLVGAVPLICSEAELHVSLTSWLDLPGLLTFVGHHLQLL